MQSFARIASVATVLIIGMVSVAAAANYTISVNAADVKEPWNRFYQHSVASCRIMTVLKTTYTNYDGRRNTQNALKRGFREAGFKYLRAHNIFGEDVGIYKETNGVVSYDWTKMDSIYQAILSTGMKPFVELSYMPKQLASGTSTVPHWYDVNKAYANPPKDYDKYRTLITDMVKHLIGRFGLEEVRTWLFEVYNEPDLFLSPATQATYFKMYDYASEGVRLADSLCKVGGPSVSGGTPGPDWIGPFLDHVLKGTNAATGRIGAKCDFLTFHRYADNSDKCGGGLSSTSSMNCYHKWIVDVVKAKGFTGKLYLTEWGPTYLYNQAIRNDETTASFVAKTIHLLMDNGQNYPPPDGYAYWVLSDFYEEIYYHALQNPVRHAFDDGNYGLLLRGDPAVPASWDLPKPSFQAYRMLHQMGDKRIALTGGTTANGVNGCATISDDNNSIQILLYNHFDGAGAGNTTRDNITLTVNGIPFGPGSMTVQHRIVDGERSNTFRAWVAMGRPAQPSAAQWNTIIAASELANQDPVAVVDLPAKTWTKTFTQRYYSVALLTLTKGDATSSIPDDRPGGVLTKRDLVPRVSLQNRTLLVQSSGEGKMVVNLHRPDGKLALRLIANESGAYALDRALPAGAYLMKCKNASWSSVTPVMVGR